jgi:hypothetical protein
MKRIVVFIVVFVSLAPTAIYSGHYNNVPNQKTGNAPITTLPHIIAESNTLITVPVVVQDFYNIGAISLRIEYDPNVLVYHSYAFNSSLPYFIVNDPIPGVLSSGNFYNQGMALPDQSILFSITFEYLGGYSALTWVDDGNSCEYASWPDYQPLSANPFEDFFINGSVNQQGLPEVPEVINLLNKTIVSGDTLCYNASDTIRLENFLVLSGGVVTLISNGTIQLMTGTMVDYSGKLHAYISDIYCTNPSPLVKSSLHLTSIYTESEKAHPGNQFLRVFPNPVRSLLTIELSDLKTPEDISVEIYNMLGESLFNSGKLSTRSFQLDWSNNPPGLYIIRVKCGGFSEILKFIKL